MIYNINICLCTIHKNNKLNTINNKYQNNSINNLNLDNNLNKSNGQNKPENIDKFKNSSHVDNLNINSIIEKAQKIQELNIGTEHEKENQNIIRRIK